MKRILPQRYGSGARAALQQLELNVAWFQRLVVDELRPRAGRLRTATRMALIAAVGTTVMLALHISGPLGAIALWVGLFASKVRMTVAHAFLLFAVVGAALIGAVFVAGALLDAPWILLPVFGLTAALIPYTIYRYALSGPWLISGIGVLDTFYMAVFNPDGFGWAAANAFAGIAVAIAVLLAFDAALWPDPAERRLLRSVAGALDRERRRLTTIVSAYVDPHGGHALPEPGTVSIMPAQLPLLEGARQELRSPAREAVLLAAVMTTERVHIETERLLVIARADVARDIRARLARDIERSAAAIESALAQEARIAAIGAIPSTRAQYEATRSEIRASREALQTHAGALGATLTADQVAAASRVAAFDRGLHDIGELLDQPLGFVEAATFAKESTTRSAAADRSLIHHCAKVGVAVTIGYVVGLGSNRSDLGVIVWMALIAGQPTYGATLHKTILFIIGAVIGGGLAVATSIVVTPNYDTVSVYMVAFFAVMFGASYVVRSSGRLSYAGSQAGVTFIFSYYALDPHENIHAPLWRLWGALVGLTIVSTVFLLVRPAYAGKAIAPRLATLFGDALQLLRPDAGLSRAKIHDIARESTQQLTQLLGIAQDARLEGRHSELRPDRVIEVAGTVRRIMQRLGAIAIGRLALPQVTRPPELIAAEAGIDAALRARMEVWLEAVRQFAAFGKEQHADRRRVMHEAAEHIRGIDLAAPLKALDQCVSALLARAWPPDARNRLLAELTTYDELRTLMGELDEQLGHLPVIPAGA